MIRVAHLLDDFGMGGVTRALTLFEAPAIKRIAQSQVINVSPLARIAPKLDADLVVDHMALSWARLAFLLSLRIRNPQARIVHVEHSYTRSFEASMVESTKRFRAMLRLAAGMVDEIVCVSEAQRQWLLADVGLSADNLRVIYPWTDRNGLLAIEPIKAMGKRPVCLLAYGRYSAAKNFDQLIVAMRSFNSRDVQLTIFGAGPESAAMIELAKDLPHVKVCGPSADPSAFLADCDAVIVPSRYEAFGLVATEARMAARAVIVADVDGLPEQASIGGIVAPMGGAYDIARAIRRTLSQDLAHLGRLARRGVAGQGDAIISSWSELITAKPSVTKTTVSHASSKASANAAA